MGLRQVVTLALALVGVAGVLIALNRGPMSMLLTVGTWDWPALFGPDGGVKALGGLTVVAVAVAGVPVLAFGTKRCLDAIDGLAARGPNLAAMFAGAIAGIYLIAAVLGQHRPLYPYVHDESSYLIQAHQLARFRLWMPAHPVGDFFDSFQLFVRPKYASAYFPGTAIARVPAIWLGVPNWIWSIGIAAVVCGLLFRVMTELLDGTSAVLAVLMLVADDMFRQQATATLAWPVLLMYGLSAVLCWMTWTKSPRRRWAVCVGLCLSLAAATRPVDALCFGLPIGLAMLAAKARSPSTGTRGEGGGEGDSSDRNRGKAAPSVARKHPHPNPLPEYREGEPKFATIGWIVVGTLPMLILQLTINKGVTGEVTRSPFRVYADENYPGTAYGFPPFDPTIRPTSVVRQKRDLYEQDVLPLVRRHTPATALADVFRLPPPMDGARGFLVLTQSTAFGFPPLLWLIPACLAGQTVKRAVLIAGGVLFPLLYMPYAFFFPGYVSTAGPAVIVAVLTGVWAIDDAFPTARRSVRSGLVIWVAVLAASNLPIFVPERKDAVFDSPLLEKVEAALSKLDRPSIVLFGYDPARNLNEEPVYNADVAWPDDARVIRAHDLGSRNSELLRYYDAKTPVRTVYHFDERTGELVETGRVGKD